MNISIVSRNTIFRNAVVQLCAGRGITICDSVDSCGKLTAETVGRVLLLHILDHDVDPIETVSGLLHKFAGIKIVALVPEMLDVNFDGRFGDRVTASIPDTVPSEALLSALYLADMGYSVRNPAHSSGPMKEAGTGLPDPAKLTEEPEIGKHQLSNRELSVLAHLCAGHSNKVIARSLGICDATVKAHLRSSFRRIGASNRTQAAMWALQNLSHIQTGQA